MECKYYRELKHNYLIFENDGQEAGKNDIYQYRIIESGRIKGLVPCAERKVNGRKYYYYEINSMQTLGDRFMVRRMNYRQLTNLLSSIKKLLEDMSEFLLGDEALVFNTSYIYADLSSEEFKMLFCPFFDEEMSFSEFTVQLLELVDPEDEKATDLAYRLCERSGDHGDFVYELIDELLKMSGAETSERREASGNRQRTKSGSEFRKQSPVKDNISENYLERSDEIEDLDELYGDIYDEDIRDDHEDEGDASGSERKKRTKLRGSGKVQLLLSLLFGCVIGAMVYIRMNYILSPQENILSILVMLVSAVTGVVSLVGGIKLINAPGKKNNAKEEKSENDKEKKNDMDTFDFDDDYGDEDTWEEDFDEEFGDNKRPVRVSSRGDVSFSDEVSCGMETVVLDEDFSGEMALFSRNLDKTMRIALEKLPITIGKMEGCVDKVIKDPSISRIHCRFVSEGGRVAVLDLGSTNGTYRNGLRIPAKEKTYVEEGDEIRIGRVCFDCR